MKFYEYSTWFASRHYSKQRQKSFEISSGKFYEYTGNDVEFYEITPELILRFVDWMIRDEGYSLSRMRVHVENLRAIYTIAMERGEAKTMHNPFEKALMLLPEKKERQKKEETQNKPFDVFAESTRVKPLPEENLSKERQLKCLKDDINESAYEIAHLWLYITHESSKGKDSRWLRLLLRAKNAYTKQNLESFEHILDEMGAELKIHNN